MHGKSVLVTGAGGSIGSELCVRLLNAGVSRLKLLSLTEAGLYAVNRKLKALNGHITIEAILGSVTNERLVRECMVGTDVVIHAAAHKHVPICEENPCEAVVNNVFGTRTLLDAAILQEVEQFVLISTDKAVRPASVMGATKRVAEMLVQSVRSEYTNFVIVRFGNVLDSAGSVLPLWREQLAAGGPITITDERCERYFMSIPEACELVAAAAEIGLRDGGGVFVFDMGKPVKIVELARRLLRESDGRGCGIKFTGLRQGEKLTEELYVGQQLAPTSHPKVFRVAEPEPWLGLHLLEDLRSFAVCGSRPNTEQALRAIVA